MHLLDRWLQFSSQCRLVHHDRCVYNNHFLSDPMKEDETEEHEIKHYKIERSISEKRFFLITKLFYLLTDLISTYTPDFKLILLLIYLNCKVFSLMSFFTIVALLSMRSDLECKLGWIKNI